MWSITGPGPRSRHQAEQHDADRRDHVRGRGDEIRPAPDGPARRDQPRGGRGRRPRRGARVLRPDLRRSSCAAAAAGWRSSTWATSSSRSRRDGRRPPDAERHIGLVVDDRPGALAAAREAGAEMIGDNDFRDPWGNHFQVVAYSDIQFTKTDRILEGMGLGGLEKSERALARAAREGPCGLASPPRGGARRSRPPPSGGVGPLVALSAKTGVLQAFPHVVGAVGLRDRRRRRGRLVRRRRVLVDRRRRAAGTSRTCAPTAPSTAGFCPKPDGVVRALARVGGTLYVGGGHAGGARERSRPRHRDRARAPVEPRARRTFGVFDLSADGRGVLYVTGEFRHVGGKARRNLAAISLANGRATRFAPNPDVDHARRQRRRARSSAGGSVYAWGIFSRIGGLPRDSFARLDPVTGHALPTVVSPICPTALLADGPRLLRGHEPRLRGVERPAARAHPARSEADRLAARSSRASTSRRSAPGLGWSSPSSATATSSAGPRTITGLDGAAGASSPRRSARARGRRGRRRRRPRARRRPVLERATDRVCSPGL